MSSKHIYIIRHAPVVGKKGFIYGDDADIDLDSQVKRISELATLLPNPAQSLWYHSGVDRAHRTAKAVLSAMQYEGDPVTPHQGFREQDFGELVGQKHEDITEHLQFINGKIYAPHPPKGESIVSFVSRTGAAISDVKQQAIGAGKDNIVIFCHGGTIRAAHIFLSRLNETQFIDLDTPPLFAYRHGTDDCANLCGDHYE